jgi:hypothetical protein
LRAIEIERLPNGDSDISGGWAAEQAMTAATFVFRLSAYPADPRRLSAP